LEEAVVGGWDGRLYVSVWGRDGEVSKPRVVDGPRQRRRKENDE
jgi:hypothetical protein